MSCAGGVAALVAVAVVDADGLAESVVAFGGSLLQPTSAASRSVTAVHCVKREAGVNMGRVRDTRDGQFARTTGDVHRHR